jgi:hypothetical protein
LTVQHSPGLKYDSVLISFLSVLLDIYPTVSRIAAITSAAIGFRIVIFLINLDFCGLFTSVTEIKAACSLLNDNLIRNESVFAIFRRYHCWILKFMEALAVGNSFIVFLESILGLFPFLL